MKTLFISIYTQATVIEGNISLHCQKRNLYEIPGNVNSLRRKHQMFILYVLTRNASLKFIMITRINITNLQFLDFAWSICLKTVNVFCQLCIKAWIIQCWMANDAPPVSITGTHVKPSHVKSNSNILRLVP